jgi:hypothetical protein
MAIDAGVPALTSAALPESRDSDSASAPISRREAEQHAEIARLKAEIVRWDRHCKDAAIVIERFTREAEAAESLLSAREQEIARLTDLASRAVDDLGHEVNRRLSLESELEADEQQLAALTSALVEYGQHKDWCECSHEWARKNRYRFVAPNRIYEFPKHVCGLTGYNGMGDQSCIGCSGKTIERDRHCTCGFSALTAEKDPQKT